MAERVRACGAPGATHRRRDKGNEMTASAGVVVATARNRQATVHVAHSRSVDGHLLYTTSHDMT